MPTVLTLETPADVAGQSSTTLTSAGALSLAGDFPPLPPLADGRNEPTLLPILVAEDDVDDLFFVQRLIKKTGAKNPVQTFEDGSAVVNYLTRRAGLAAPGKGRRDPLLLFLDLNMKGLDGFGFLEWARQQREFIPLTIVILSNSGEPADMARALELGAHRYLVKYPGVQTFATLVASVYPQRVF